MLSVDIKLDGVSIMDRIDSAEIIYDLGAVHNTIKIVSKDPSLFAAIDPVYDGVAHIAVEIGTDTLYFLLEPPKIGHEHDFSFGGRSLSAREEKPYAISVTLIVTDIAMSDNDLVSNVVNLLSASQTINWDLQDFVLPANYLITGIPMQKIAELAEIFGGICRCDDTGEINIVKKYPYTATPFSGGVVPLPGADAILDIDDGIWDASYSLERGDRFDMISVHKIQNTDAPDIEALPTFSGDDMTIRVWWPENQLDATPDLFSTSGTLSKEAANRTYTITENVTFTDHSASVNKRIKTLVSVNWLGFDGGNVTWKPGETTLISAELAGFAEIVYTTECHEFVLSGTASDSVIIAFAPSGLDEPYQFTIGSAPSLPAPTVRNPLLSETGAKRLRGVSELINAMDRHKITLNAPLDARIKDGDIIALSAELLGCSGKFVVEKVTTHIEQIKTYNTIEMIQCFF